MSLLSRFNAFISVATWGHSYHSVFRRTMTFLHSYMFLNRLCKLPTVHSLWKEHSFISIRDTDMKSFSSHLRTLSAHFFESYGLAKLFRWRRVRVCGGPGICLYSIQVCTYHAFWKWFRQDLSQELQVDDSEVLLPRTLKHWCRSMNRDLTG